MMAGLVLTSMWAAARLWFMTVQAAWEPQKTRTKASWLGEEETVLVSPPTPPELVVALFTAR